MQLFRDQIGQEIELTNPPKRIISLVPSQTELLHYLDLDDEVIGITKFCIHPQTWHQEKVRVGGTKNVDLEKVNSLRPDLIICNKEENVKEQVESMREIAPVWTSDVNSVEDALEMISAIGRMTNREEQSEKLIEGIATAFTELKENSLGTCLYFIWKDPFYLVGKNTFIDTMLERCGFKNLCVEERYPNLNEIEVEESPDFILLSSEPFPFNESHIPEVQKHFPESKVLLVDGEYFSWYGSRMLGVTDYIKSLQVQINS